MYLLDTNVCIRFLNRKSSAIINKLLQLDPDDVFLCSMVKAELFYGAHKSNNPEKAIRIQREFCSRFRSLYFGDGAANVYGEIRADLEKRGEIIGPNDLIIASIAIAENLVLVTHNVKEFSRVEGLVYEDWEK